MYQILTQLAKEMHLPVLPTIPPSVVDDLSRYQWPGNVRELRNVIERAVILSKGPRLSLDFLPLTEPPEPRHRTWPTGVGGRSVESCCGEQAGSVKIVGDISLHAEAANEGPRDGGAEVAQAIPPVGYFGTKSRGIIPIR